MKNFLIYSGFILGVLLGISGFSNKNYAFTGKKLDKNWNIHKTGQCVDCHSPVNKANIGRKVKEKGFDQFCKQCHTTHKIDHTRNLSGEKVDSRFVLEKGKYISCVTCHEEKECRDEKSKGEVILRGGPYETGEQFCNQCHGVNAMVRKVSPHPYNTKDQSSCLVCHTTGNERSITDAKDKRLKQPHEKLCQNCHTDDFHHMSKSHQGKRLDKGVVTNLPLNSLDRIFCGTCHVSHLKKDKPGNTRLPIKSNQLCLQCHKFSSGF